MKNLSLSAFTEQVASKEPIPGGGSVSAQAGAQAAALLLMYCQLSLGKAGTESLEQTFAETLREAGHIRDSLLDDIEKDSDAFRAVVNAYKLPKSNEEEKELRRAAIQEAYTGAARVPLDVADKCLRLLEMIHTLAGKGNNNAITDIGVGNLLAWAGLQGALYNVRINLSSIKDQLLSGEFRSASTRILGNGHGLYQNSASIVEALIGEEG